MVKPVADILEDLKRINTWLDGTTKITHDKMARNAKYDVAREDKNLSLIAQIQAELAALEAERQNIDKNDPRSERIGVLIQKLNDKADLLEKSIASFRAKAIEQQRVKQDMAAVKAAPSAPKQIPKSEPEVKKQPKYNDPAVAKLEEQVKWEVLKTKVAQELNQHKKPHNWKEQVKAKVKEVHEQVKEGFKSPKKKQQEKEALAKLKDQLPSTPTDAPTPSPKKR